MRESQSVIVEQLQQQQQLEMIQSRSNGMVYAAAQGTWNPMSNYHNYQQHHHHHHHGPDHGYVQVAEPWRSAYHQQHHQLQYQQNQVHQQQFQQIQESQQQANNQSIHLSLMTSSSSEESSTTPSVRNASVNSGTQEWLLDKQPSASSKLSKNQARIREESEWETLSLRPPNPTSRSPQISQTPATVAAPPAGLDLVNVLLKCAEAIDGGDMASTIALLSTLKSGARAHGDSMQRLAMHFSQALATRAAAIHGTAGSLFKNPKTAKNPNFASDGDDLGAFTALYKVSPFFQIAHFTANQAILEATQDHEWIHVIDLDVMAGFQWPSLMQSLASRPGGPPSGLRITGLGSDEQALHETGVRLRSFASACGIPAFEFHSGRIEAVDRIKLRPTEAVAVNCAFLLHKLHGRVDAFLASVAERIRPVVVTVAEQEASHNSASFVQRFMHALQYYAAVFDSLDASLPRLSEERAAIEGLIFGRQIANIVACEGEERSERHERMDVWASKMNDAGFRQVPLSSHAVSQARLLLQMCPCDGYRLVETPLFDTSVLTSAPSSVGSISLGWHEDRLLLTASAWALDSTLGSHPSSPLSY